MGTVFKNQSPACLYCILCPFSEDRDILTIPVSLIGRRDFYCVNVSPQLIALRFNDSSREALSVASMHDHLLKYTSRRFERAE